MAEFRDEIGNQIFLAVRVDQGKRRAGHGQVRQIVFGAFGEILDHIGQEFQLLDQVRIFGRIDLCEFHFQERKLLVNSPQNLRRDLRRAVMNEFYNLGHGRILPEPPTKDKRVWCETETQGRCRGAMEWWSNGNDPSATTPSLHRYFPPRAYLPISAASATTCPCSALSSALRLVLAGRFGTKSSA